MSDKFDPIRQQRVDLKKKVNKAKKKFDFAELLNDDDDFSQADFSYSNPSDDKVNF